MWRAKLGLNGLYYCLRALRPHDLSERRKLYRYIAKERARLIAAGHDPEALRLRCRALKNPRLEYRYQRYETRMREIESAGVLGGALAP